MIRKTLLILSALSIVAVPVAAQNRVARRGPPTPPDAGIFFGAFQAIRDYSLIAHNDSTLWDKALDGLIAELDDPYATIFTPESFDEFQEENTGNYAGIGVQITNLNETITITAVFRNTPAAHAGLLVGDLIVGVNGVTTQGWTTAQASDTIRGEAGTDVDLTVARKGMTSLMHHTLTRDNVHVSSVVADMITPDVGYIALDRVARSSAQEVDSALTHLAAAESIVFDLRGNPGGFLDESLMLSDLFLETGQRLARLESRTPRERGGAKEEVWNAKQTARIPHKPIVVLVDRFSASAAEIVAGALQDHDRAVVFGERTFGKGIVQSVIRLSESRHLRLTTGEWFTPLGRSLHRRRDQQGRPLPEDPESFPTVVTAGGRELSGGGGIFPDLVIQADTLKTVERVFLSQAARDSVPLGLRIEEFAFGIATRLNEDGAGPALDEGDFRSFADGLAEEGTLKEQLDDPVVLDYLRWRVMVRMTDRMGRLGESLKIRAERDAVLAEAIRLLGEVETQPELFAMVDKRELDRRRRASTSGGER
ncbi:MAG: PDZ domain-containing protein [Gemmatimonadetes bacterium]|nr:PDZ domain-containing protein [Gemmatimonadota bacterium]